MHRGDVAGRGGDRRRGVHPAERGDPRDHSQHPEGLRARARRAVGARHQAGELAPARHQGGNLASRLHVAVVDHLDARGGLVEDPLDVGERERGRAAVHVSGHVGPHPGDEVRAHDAAARDRGATRVHHHAHAARLGPPGHLGGDLGVLHARDADLADEIDAGRCHLVEVGLGEPGLQQHRARMHLHAGGAQLGERGVGQDREGLHPGRIGGAARRVRLARRDHRGGPPVQVGIDEARLELARCVVADHRVRVVVAQPRHDGGAAGVDRGVDARPVVVGRGDEPVTHHHGVGLARRAVDVAGDEDPDVADDEVAHRRPSSPTISDTSRPPTRGSGRPPSVTATAITSSSSSGASTTRSSTASKWVRTNAASL